MKRYWKMLAFGNSLAIIVASIIAIVRPAALKAQWFQAGVAAIVVAVAWQLFGRESKPKQQPGQLVPGTRRWARALYYNKLISMEELNRFYLTHPEDENGDSDASS